MNVSAALSHCPKYHDASRVLMAHNPATVREIEPEDLATIDLVLSGEFVMSLYDGPRI